MDFNLTTLGTSAAGPVPGRWASGQYFKTPNTGFLIDAGEGTQIALQRNGIGWGAIDVILISHMHGDHIYGLPGLLTSWALNQRSTPLTIIGPANLQPFLKTVFQYSYTGLPFRVDYVTTDSAPPGSLVYEDKHVRVTTIPLVHRVPTTGYLIAEKERLRTMRAELIDQYQIPYREIPGIKAGADFVTASGQLIPNAELTSPAPPTRSFAYCSDTMPDPKIIPYIKGVDLLFHEATFLDELAEHAVISTHTTAKQAANVAQAAQAKQLVIGHFSPRYGNLQPLLEEANAIFPNTALAKEGRVFTVAYAGRQ
ncbi:MAG: ribonuclease Z [Bacteroidota bacterium]